MTTTCPIIPRHIARLRLALLLGSVLSLTTPAFGSDQAVTIDRVQDVIQAWQPEQHLYIKGDIGIRRQRLDELEQWLDQHGPNWTVVLMQNAEGESFRAADGQQYENLDAAEYALGQGLIGATQFGDQRDARTGESNGAIFLLSLEERSFSYFSSELQNRLRLGESRWQGHLDQPAVGAMRQGGNIVAAVEATVTSIQAAVDKAVTDEQEAAKRAAQAAIERAEREARQRKLDVVELRQRIETNLRALDQVQQARDQLQEQYPEAQGPLVEPPIAAWRAGLQQSAELLSEKTTDEVQSRLSQIEGARSQYARQLEQHQAFALRAESLATALDQFDTGPDGLAEPLIESASEVLQAAVAAHANAEIPDEQAFVAVSQSMTQAQNEIDQAAAAVRAEQRRRQLQQQLAAAGSGGTALLAGLGLVFLNRRRKPLRQQAFERFVFRREQVRAGTDGMLGLLKRTDIVVGKEADLSIRGSEGETLRLSKQTIDDVDHLFIMSRSVDQVIKEAHQLLYPGSPTGKLSNMFHKSRYQECIELLDSKEIRFTPEDGIRLLEAAEETERTYLFGDINEVESFELTFEQLLDEFDRRAQRAVAALDQIELAWSTLVPEMEGVQSEIDELLKLEDETTDATERDGYLELQRIFTELAPLAQKERDEAERLGATDPVSALNDHTRRAQRLVRDGRRLVDIVISFRKETLPDIENHGQALRDAGHPTDWIHEALLELSTAEMDLTSRVVAGAGKVPADASGDEAIAEWEGALHELGKQAAVAIELSVRGREESDPHLEQVRQQVAEARQEIGAGLGIGYERVLRETDRDPDTRLESAQRQRLAATAAIDRGGVLAAAAALNEVTRFAEQASAIVDVTRAAYQDFAGQRSKIAQRGEEIRATHTKHAELLAQLTTQYAPSALRITLVDPSYPDSDDTISQHIYECDSVHAEAVRWVDDADRAFAEARLLESLSLLERAAERWNQVQVWYDQIRHQAEGLERQQNENQKMAARIEVRVTELVQQRDEHRTTQPTQEALAAARQATAQVIARVRSTEGPQSPFEIAANLQQVVASLDDIDRRLQVDRDAYAEAARSLDAASAEAQTAERQVSSAGSDQIPDSRQTSQTIAQIQTLTRALQNAQSRLRTPHEDWEDVDREADRLTAELGRANAGLRKELRQAQDSLATMQRAASEVRRATHWQGGYGVTITGSPGSSELSQARAALNRGDYGSALLAAKGAESAAERAIREAESRVIQLRREQERQEAARRRRQRQRQAAMAASAMRSISSSRSRGSSSIGSSMGSSRSSSSSRSSFKSGSGFSRSGW